MTDDFAHLVADVYEAAGELRRWGERIAAAEDQTQTRWQVLSAVSDGLRSVPDAARRLGISRQAVQRTANDLVADGLVRFVDNPGHRTSPLVELTSAGREVLRRLTDRAAVANDAVVARLGEVDLAAARATLRAVCAHLRADPAAPPPAPRRRDARSMR